MKSLRIKIAPVILFVLASSIGFAQQQTSSTGHGGRRITVTVTYNSEENVWKGSEVTWTISYTPESANFSVSKLSVSGTGFTRDGMSISYDCPTESSSLTDKKVPTVSYDGTDVSPSEGPVVFKLNSAVFDTDVVCEEEPAQLVITTTPDYEGSFSNLPTVTFTPSPIDSQGNISQDHDLEPGNHAFTASGDVDLDDTLNVLSGTENEWVVVEEANFNASPPSDQAFCHTWQDTGRWVTRYRGYKGTAGFSHMVEDYESFESQNCGGEITASQHTAYTIGISGGFSYGGVSATTGVTYQSSLTYSTKWGEDNRVTKVETKLAKRNVVYTADEELNSIIGAGGCSSSDWESITPKVVKNKDFVYAAAQADVSMYCCQTSP